MFENYSPQQLRDGIEIEMRYTSDAKIAAMKAIINLSKNPQHYESMLKAKDISKLVKKVITNKKGHQQIVYVKGAEQEKIGWLDKFANLFGIKDRLLAIQKAKIDYNNNNIQEKYDITFDVWKNHLSEYLKNKDKWDKFFSGKKEKKEKKPTEKKKTGVKKSVKEKTASGLRLAVMREIFNMYGNRKEQKNNFETMPEKEKKETPEQKKYDKKVSKAINEVTSDNRLEKERDITEVPEPPEIIETPISNVEPFESEITIPIYKGGGSENFPAKDYTKISLKDVYLANVKTILDNPRPSYIPEVNKDEFRYSLKCYIPTVKISEDKYIIRTKSPERSRKKGEVEYKETPGEYAIVNRDILAAIHDYYIKLLKAEQNKEKKEFYEKTGRKLKQSRISIIPENKMTYATSAFMSSFTGAPSLGSFAGKERIKNWDMYGEIRNDIKQKISDMEIQIEEYYNTHAKGRETAYGDKGLKDNLLNDYGVMVKRQNGDEINDIEINEIKDALTIVFDAFGNRSEMSKKFGLKISHSGDVKMHASKAVGLFIPSMKAIGVTAKYGESGTGFILSHEFGHFMDYYLGDKGNRHYASDDPEGISGKIASTFRKIMDKPQSSMYENRTCECFARAMEQYWAIKTKNEDILNKWNQKGNHPNNEKFKEIIYPLCEQFFQENAKMLKAIFKFKNKYFKRI